MYNIARESLFEPKQIVKYHKKSGWFVFLYFMVLILFMSLGGIVFYASSTNDVITEETTGCQITNGTYVCDAVDYDPSVSYKIYNFDLYILNETDSVANITNFSSAAIVLKGHQFYFDISGYQSPSFSILNANPDITFDQSIKNISSYILAGAILSVIISQVVSLLFIILISSITFLRLRKFIAYKKMFKMIVFATTPVALLLTIHNLVPFSDFIFLIFLFIAWRSIFVLQKELYLQTALRAAQQQNVQFKSQDDVEQGEDIEIVDDEEDEEDKD